jgi:hypothetical protein
VEAAVALVIRQTQMAKRVAPAAAEMAVGKELLEPVAVGLRARDIAVVTGHSTAIA